MARAIYLVDDDEAVRASLRALLSLQPERDVQAFRNGDDFLQAADALDSGVVLLDFHMPGSTGLDVLAALRERSNTRFAVIVVTGEGNVPLAVQAMKAGAIDFLEKPYDAGTLLQSIEVAFSRLHADAAAAARTRQAEVQIEALSPRERDVLTGLIDGRANKMIAYDLDISARTVEIYRANLMTKLGVHSLPEALRIAFAAGLIPQQ